MRGVLLSREHRWECPNCTTTAVTYETKPHVRFHNCPGLGGLEAPLIAAGTRAKVEVRVREDYIGSERVRLLDGKPVMSVVTTRDDGQDCAVFAPVAVGRVRE